MSEQQACRSCGAAVWWLANATTGKRAPIDAAPSERGNLVVNLATGQYRVTLAEEREAHPGARLYINHFVTCPQAHKWHMASDDRIDQMSGSEIMARVDRTQAEHQATYGCPLGLDVKHERLPEHD